MLANGKYRYYYDQSELDDLGRNAEYARKQAAAATSQLNSAQAAYNTAAATQSSAWYAKTTAKGVSAKSQSRKNLRVANQDLDDKEWALRKAKRAQKSATRLAERYTKRYERKKIISFPRRTIAKGAVAIANLFDRGD